MSDDYAIAPSEFEIKDRRVVIIGKALIKDYFWVIALVFRHHRECVLWYMQGKSHVVMELIDMYRTFAIEEVRGSRQEVAIKDQNGNPRRVVEVVLKKPGMLGP